MKLSLELNKKLRISEKSASIPAIKNNLSIDELGAHLNLDFLDKDDPLVFSQVKNQVLQVNKILKEKKISLVLLLNDACLGGKNHTLLYRKRLSNLLELAASEAIPLGIMEPSLIRHICSQDVGVDLIIFTSSSHGIFDFHLRCEYYQKYFNRQGNIKRVMVPSDLNRDFAGLEKIRECCDFELGINVNEGDIFCSPYRLCEISSLSHIDPHKNIIDYNFIEDIFYNFRKETFLKEPWKLIASPWVRPEDIKFYEKLGINVFNILTNGSESRQISLLVDAYRKRSYKGNIVSLLKESCRLEDRIFLENQWFDHFLGELRAGGGCIRDCKNCRICIMMEEGLRGERNKCS